jgi:hypothetical protein
MRIDSWVFLLISNLLISNFLIGIKFIYFTARALDDSSEFNRKCRLVYRLPVYYSRKCRLGIQPDDYSEFNRKRRLVYRLPGYYSRDCRLVYGELETNDSSEFN